MACLACGDDRSDDLCSACVEQGWESHGCGCLTDPEGVMRVSTKCAQHLPCIGVSDDCTGEGLFEVWTGERLDRLCLPCRRWLENQQTNHDQGAAMMPDNVKCPECGGRMVSRLNQKQQRRFWGCSDYPRCRGTRDTDGRSKQDREREYGDGDSSDEIADAFHPGHPRFYGSN